MSSTTSGRWLAIATGAAASAGALYILLKDDVMSGRWSDAFVLVPVMVGISIAAGHLCWSALAGRSYLAALGFALAFALGSVLTVYTSVGKQAATSDATALAVKASNDLRQAKEGELARARVRFTDAQTMADRERSEKRCGQKCQDWERRGREVEAYIRQIESDLATMDPPKPIAAPATRFARFAGLFLDIDSASLSAKLDTVQPLAYSLLFELTAIVALGYGFGHRQAPTAPASCHVEPPRRKRGRPRNHDGEVVDWVRAFRERHGRDPQIPELQMQFPAVPRTTAWRRCKSD